MPVTIGGGLTFCGRELRPEELDLIRQITRDFSTLSLTELAHTVCELLEWRRPNGGLKSRECYLFLQALHTRHTRGLNLTVVVHLAELLVGTGQSPGAGREACPTNAISS
jgi:hypothetical protein